MINSSFDEFGDYRKRVEVQQHSALSIEDSVDRCVMYHTNQLIVKRFDNDIPNDDGSYIYEDDDDSIIFYDSYMSINDNNSTSFVVQKGESSTSRDGITVKAKEPDYSNQRPLFAWLPTDVVKKTYELTTQYARIPMSTTLRKRYLSPNPALNVFRRSESVATDTVFSDTPAVDSGITSAQFFVGCDSMVCDVYPMKTSKQFVNTLEDNIRDRGAMNRLISDSAQVEISNKVQDILRSLFIKSWQSEPYYQHQNLSERRFQTVKRTTNTVLDRTGSPPSVWLLCMLYVVFVLNNTFCDTIKAVPLQHLNGQTTDISPLLCFRFWEEVYYMHDDPRFPSETVEGHGHFVGIAESVGNAMTFKILTSDTNKVIFRSVVRSAETFDKNQRAEMGRRLRAPLLVNDRNISAPDSEDGNAPQGVLRDTQDESQSPASPPDVSYDEFKKPPKVVTSRHDHTEDDIPLPSIPIMDPEDLVGLTFLLDNQEDG